MPNKYKLIKRYRFKMGKFINHRVGIDTWPVTWCLATYDKEII